MGGCIDGIPSSLAYFGAAVTIISAIGGALVGSALWPRKGGR
jgi:hypothetical protein